MGPDEQCGQTPLFGVVVVGPGELEDAVGAPAGVAGEQVAVFPGELWGSLEFGENLSEVRGVHVGSIGQRGPGTLPEGVPKGRSLLDIMGRAENAAAPAPPPPLPIEVPHELDDLPVSHP